MACPIVCPRLRSARWPVCSRSSRPTTAALYAIARSMTSRSSDGGEAWSGPAAQAAQAVRQLAEGQEVRQQTGTSGWMVAVYIVAGLFGLEILLGLVSLGISLLGG